MTDAPQKRILIVDDEKDIRTFLQVLFRDNGYETVTAEDGEAGLKILRESPVDLITLDLQMPNETGTQMYRKLTKDPKLAGIPVIVVSGVAGRHLAIRQPFAVFDKPIEREELMEAVRKAIG